MPDENEVSPFDLRASLEANAAAQLEEGGEGQPGQQQEQPVTPAADQQRQETPEQKEARERDDKGRFKAKEEGDGEKDGDKPGGEPGRDKADGDGKSVKTPDAKDSGQLPGGSEQAEAAAAAAPPPGWSVAAKAEWEKLPAPVREAIAKRESEVNEGFAQYSGMKDLKPYAEAYREQGTTIRGALEAFHAAENRIRQDPVNGTAWMLNAIGVDARLVAQRILGLTPQQQPTPAGQQQEQQPGGQPAPVPDALAQLVAPLQQQVQQLTSTITERDRRERQAALDAAEKEMNSFATNPKNKYFENVRPLMGQLISTGQATGLEDAYEKAIWATPEIRAVLIKEQAARAATETQLSRQTQALNAKAAAKSVTGAPTPGSTSGAGAKPQSTRALLEAAAAEQTAGV